MIGLAIHTSSPELGLALHDFEQGTERSQVWPLGRDLTAYLHDCLADFLSPYAWSDIAYLSVAKGPGGFTGTRIGVVVARTLAQQLQVPLFGVSSFAAIAQHYQLTAPSRPEGLDQIAVSLRAQRGEIFGAIYQAQPPVIAPVLPETLYSQAGWEAKLKHWTMPHHYIAAQEGLAHTVSGVLSLAQQSWQTGDRPPWSSVLPFYGQHPVRQA
ncbi:tRNA (adenosine(37)-N6)-threonylcarbamoyltransferase complex dimerization subunit type 1 TsaB [Leptolyngbya iicbica]|uniref:tRNA (Adenosine(37)-N6)-threonylcarbamoyltransferase complex dimerization subunit type 1 TsaB n=2 Tax=Cyanophyceae TaxID=3028117 RepID=A0A4Q7E9Q9_9CYAN|nr:tRNA (adenosine(37)-N6)-threonylcarbamoyltransferase complex dimerization subunit type 1 TsaB [Leptolyngbya sp. LK]RZM79169.1 tRNA (adenosine(37)-N6)-threonylcarbamoyltransferase complex dimerization subunit type 1 TsaB [Leptolyngbya sp. LK]